MRRLRDCYDNIVRLSDERLAHILRHPEMHGLEDEIGSVLRNPGQVRRSRSDGSVLLFYKFYAQTIVGGKWLCVVVKCIERDAFGVTAYLTDKPKEGEVMRWDVR